jgi:predicted N-acyltransferase
MTDIELFDTIADVDSDEWDELAKGNVTASYAWLRLVEETSLEQRRCRCLLAREGSRLKAAIFLWENQPRDIRNSLDYVMFGRLSRVAGLLGLTLLPAFVAAEGSGHCQTILFRGDLPGVDRRRLLSRMLDYLENTPPTKDRTLCFQGIPVDDADLAAVFSSRRYLCSPELPVCCLDIRWKSFAEYLRSLRKLHPRTEKCIHNEISRSRRVGITIQRLNEPASDCGRLHAVADSHYRRLNGRPFPFRRGFFEQIKSRMGDRAVIYAAVRDGLIIGVQVRLSSDGHATVPIIGIDREHARKDAVYFNLGYNHTIRDAIEEGLQRVRFGTLVYDTKIRRGCHLTGANLYLRPKDSFRRLLMRPLMSLRTMRMRTVLRTLIGQRPAQDLTDKGSQQS